MRDLLSLRRNEAPIIGEVYKYGAYYVKCVSGGAGKKCEKKCVFNENHCPFHCIQAPSEVAIRFEWVPKDKLETAADVKFRHVEETRDEPPSIGEKFIAAIGLVEYVEKQDCTCSPCEQCDLTQRECDETSCDCGCFYRKIKH